jgi:hypothetical protein
MFPGQEHDSMFHQASTDEEFDKVDRFENGH